ncbi:MAG: L-aspartate oxidase [Calditrichia bacterium]
MFKFDFIVVGSGIAGLTFALKAAELGSVAVITKEDIVEANTRYAQGGIASVIEKEDTIDFHFQDTLKAGANLCHKNAVMEVVKHGPDMIRQLMDWGVGFDKKSDGDLDLGREGGHSKHRIVHVHDATGEAIQQSLVKRVKENSNIQIFENTMVLDLITEHQITKQKSETITCYGVYALMESSKKIETFHSKVTCIATGGAGRIYKHTTNPEIATGDGLAMAYRAGALLGNLEFIQFHPTAFYHPSGYRFLITEAVRGFGGILRNHKGEAFMEKYHPQLKELAPRDIVARAIDSEMKIEGKPHVYLDLTHLDSESIIKRFPTIYNKLMQFDVDITREPIPVVPAAHYFCGGIATDLKGRTSVKNLYAAGEVSLTGVNGANRLASNSLLEGMVYAHNAVNHIKQNKTIDTISFMKHIPDWDDSGTFDENEWILVSHDLDEIRQIMSDYVGIVRKKSRLSRAINRLQIINQEIENFYKKTKLNREIIELRNIAQLALLIARSADFREESRGLHYILDYPETKSSWEVDTLIRSDHLFKHAITLDFPVR